MTQKVEIIKKQRFAYDGDLALIEANSCVKIFTLHLERCDDKESADSLSNIFLTLGNQFAQKSLDLAKEIG